jgi:hypothetical protein
LEHWQSQRKHCTTRGGGVDGEEATTVLLRTIDWIVDGVRQEVLSMTTIDLRRGLDGSHRAVRFPLENNVVLMQGGGEPQGRSRHRLRLCENMKTMLF